MKRTILITALLIAQHALAMGTVFSDVKSGQAQCYGRTYTQSEISRSGQVVKEIVAKFDVTSYKLQTMDVDLVVQDAEGTRKLRAELVCETANHCYIECDGGSVDLEVSKSGTLNLSNANFIIQGGCGQPGVKTLKMGQDGVSSFELAKLSSCGK